MYLRTKIAPLSQVKASTNGSKASTRTFSGFASTRHPDLGGDVVEPSAFTRSVAAFEAGRLRVPLVDSHDVGSVRNVLGKAVALEIRDEGLHATFEVVPGADGDAALERVRGGFVDGLSIGFELRDAEPVNEGGIRRRITDLRLGEISLVTFPMNPRARVTDVASPKARPHAVSNTLAPRRAAVSRIERIDRAARRSRMKTLEELLN